VNEDLFPVKAAKVLEVVADAYGLSVAELTGMDRCQPLPAARLVAYVLLHEESRLGWTAVGRVMRRPGTNSFIKQANRADPEAVDELRARLRPNGKQRSLW
jgi:hypothetical protein